MTAAPPPTFRGANLAVQTYTGEPGAVAVAEWMLAGPAETGKTWAALWRLDSLLRETPKAHAVLARRLQVSLWGTVLVTYKRIQELRQAMGDKAAEPYGGEKPEFYVYPNGARLWVGGMDNTQKILSGERDWIYINQAEELTLDDWEVLTTRCTGRGAVTKTPMIFGDCNPGPADHWILKRDVLRVFHSNHVDNPALFDESGCLTPQGLRTMATLNNLTGVRRKRLRDGKWVGIEGAFFEEFDPEDNEGYHIIEPFKIPADWYCWAAFDFGFGHNTAWGLFVQRENEIILVAEHVKNKLLPPAHCKLIRRQAEIVGVPFSQIKCTVAGHDVFMKGRDATGKTIAEQYKEARDPETGLPIGFTLSHATLDRINGWQEVQTRLGNREAGILPTLKIFSTCKRTIETLARMVADPNDAEDVKKVDCNEFGEGGDDPADMLRYGVMARRQEPIGVVKW